MVVGDDGVNADVQSNNKFNERINPNTNMPRKPTLQVRLVEKVLYIYNITIKLSKEYIF